MGSISGVAETFVAPAVSLQRLLEGVTLEGGGLPLEGGAKVEGRAESIPLRDEAPRNAWRSIPVRVTVELAGYRELQYDFRLGDPFEPRVMAREGE